MDKELARQLHVLITPEVQEALNKLLEHRKEMNLREMMNASDEKRIFNTQGAARELDFLLNVREYIINKAE